MRCAVLLLTIVCTAFGQQPAVTNSLHYAGKALDIKAQCRPEDMTAAGLACTQDDPCPVFLELTDVEQVGARLIVAGNLHTSSSTLESILLVSEDGGQNWAEPLARIPTAGLDRIEFVDFESGWIAGQTLLALPRDPFFLVTTDGGKTWRQRPIWGEARVGTVDAFHFESRLKGMILIDRQQSADNGMRYELYESNTAGDTWTLLQFSDKKLTLKQPPSDKGLRLREDAASKTYRVEKSIANRWQVLTSFHIAAGECRPPEVKEIEAPPEPESNPIPATSATPNPARKRRK